MFFLSAIRIDGINIKGYTAWSLMDNFEWERGYTERFGLHYVNFTDPKRPRIPKASARFFRDLMKDNGFYPEDKEETPVKIKSLSPCTSKGANMRYELHTFIFILICGLFLLRHVSTSK